MSIENIKTHESNKKNIDSKNINTISYEKEKLILNLQTKEKSSNLKDDFQTEKELMSYKDNLLEKFKKAGNNKIPNDILNKFSTTFNNLYDIDSKLEYLNTFNKMLTILDKGEKLNKDEIKKIFTEYRGTNEALLGVLRIIITINLGGMLLVTSGTLLTLALAISIIGFDILAVGAFADLENKSNINYKKNLLLDTINDIYPNIDENKFDRIKKALNGKNFNKGLAIISKQLKDSYSDKILSEDEIKKIEILLSKI